MNRVRFLSKIAVAASFALALAFTFSCSSDEGGSDGAGKRKGNREITEVYALKSKTNDSFTYTHTDTINGTDYCDVLGILKREADVYDKTINYLISGNTLVWQDERHDADTLHFAGTSNNLIGIWTRAMNAAYWQNPYWNVIKTEFTENELKITYDYCASDRILLRYGEDRGNGWKIRNINCETYEIYKGNDVITMKEDSRLDVISSLSVTYKGKTCSTPTVSQNEEVCSNAWKKIPQATNKEELALALLELAAAYLLYEEQIEEEFANCLVNTIPYTEVPRGDYKGFLWGF